MPTQMEPGHEQREQECSGQERCQVAVREQEACSQGREQPNQGWKTQTAERGNKGSEGTKCPSTSTHPGWSLYHMLAFLQCMVAPRQVRVPRDLHQLLQSRCAHKAPRSTPLHLGAHVWRSAASPSPQEERLPDHRRRWSESSVPPSGAIMRRSPRLGVCGRDSHS